MTTYINPGNNTGLYGINDININVPYGNANVETFLATGSDTGGNVVGNIVSSGNVTANYYIGDGSLLTGIAGTYSNADVSSYLASGTNTANMITTGNVTGAYIFGNGSQLTGVATSYNDANVATFLANFGSNTVVTTGNITGGNFVGSGAALTSLTGANVTGTVANATYATTAGAATTAGTVTTAAQPNITSVGTLSSVSVTGNATAAYFIGNGSLLTGLPANYGNADVATFLANFGSNTLVTTGNITGGNFVGSGAALTSLTGANVTGTVANATYAIDAGTATTATTAGTVTTAAQPNITSVGTLTSVSSTGNITGANINGNGSGLSSLTGANVSGTVANATYAVSAGSATTATTAGTVTSAAQPNITSVGTLTSLSVTGNIVGGNISTAGAFAAASLSAVGNITGSNIIATTLLTAPTLVTTGGTGNITGVNYITAGYFVGDGSLLTNLPNQVAGSNTQIQYNNAGALAGNSLMTFNNTTGNIALANVGIKGLQIENTTAYAVPSTADNPGRLVIGNGYDGNISSTYDLAAKTRNGHLVVWNKNNQGNATGQSVGLTIQQHTVLTESTSGTQSRTLGGVSLLQVGGGSGNYSWGAAVPYAVGGFNSTVIVGNNGSALVGNTSVVTLSGTGAGFQVNTGSSVGNAFAVLANPTIAGGTANTAIAYGTFPIYAGSGTISESIVLHNPSSTTIYNTSTSNQFRQATNGYWFLKNDDDVAISKLGSLKFYNEFNYVSNTTTGSITISKANGQVQQITPTGNITIAGYSNFVSSASNGASTIEQGDTVTLIIAQGATPYTVTMPTGATYKYSGNTTTVGATASSVTMISVTAVRISGTTTYLTTISPEFV